MNTHDDKSMGRMVFTSAEGEKLYAGMRALIIETQASQHETIAVLCKMVGYACVSDATPEEAQAFRESAINNIDFGMMDAERVLRTQRPT